MTRQAPGQEPCGKNSGTMRIYPPMSEAD
ncbi:MAG: hypothetical protein ACI9EF_003778, partial [Pseudohongiellaceae bacterium]